MHDTTRNAGLELELARPATESNGVVARVACRCDLGGTLLPFGISASHRVRIHRNNTAPRTHKFVQVGGTNTHHGRARPATKGDGVAARAACKCALGGTLLALGVCASYRVHTQRNNTTPRTREFARAK